VLGTLQVHVGYVVGVFGCVFDMCLGPFWYMFSRLSYKLGAEHIPSP
jgi:hypothetical protein